jgi:UDP-N-acetylmuramate: L-alanyl-gamma-D-glutamyl-meso-diaminopimelate ligase
MHYHLIGIAGTAMASLAGLLREKGHRVTGSDEGVYPPMSTMLDQLGIAYARRFDPANLDPAPDVVVVGNAISRGNEELEAVLERRLAYTSAAATLKEEFLRGRHVLAVAGTHGKTTTSSIVAWLLERAGLRPSFLIGGVAENFGTSFRLTDAEHFVVEADEYDTAYFDKGPKMWHYLPWTAVVTNVEFDHADIFRDEVAYHFVFQRFVNLIPRTGTLVLGWEGEVERALAPRSHAPVESFALAAAEQPDAPWAGGAPGSHPRWRAYDIEHGPAGTRFTVEHDGASLGRVVTPLSGAFNVSNCLAATAAAHAVGASWEAIAEGLGSFRSVRRRLEVKGDVRGVTVIDDFAHHPTAVGGTIVAVRQRFGARRVVAIFEPRSYTAQRREFQEAFRRALGHADRVILAGLFHPERYDRTTGMDPTELVASIRADGVEADYIPEVERIVQTAASEARAGDVLLVMSNGGFGGIHGKLLEALGRSGSR